jgi:hypothetical protein
VLRFYEDLSDGERDAVLGQSRELTRRASDDDASCADESGGIVNDLERELRELFDHDEAQLTSPTFTPSRAPKSLRGHVRRRRLGLALTSMVAVVGVAIASLFAFRVLDDRTVPASGVERTIHGITMTIPPEWHLVDPVLIGGEPDTMTYSPAVAWLSNLEPDARRRCPADAPAEVTMTMRLFAPYVEDDPEPWPVDLRPIEDVRQTRCWAGWRGFTAAWTAAGRTYSASIGIGSQASQADADAVLAAFKSMSFEPVEGSPLNLLLTDTGGRADPAWMLSASGDEGGLSVSLSWEAGAAGIGGFDQDAGLLQASSRTFETTSGQEIVVFGAADPRIVSVEAIPTGGAVQRSDVIDVPDELASDANPFVVSIEQGQLPIELLGHGGEGQPVERLTIGAPVDDGGPAGEMLSSGRTGECTWTLYGNVRGDRVDLRLVSGDGETLAELEVAIGEGAAPLQLNSFMCDEPEPATMVLGLAEDDVTDIVWLAELAGYNEAWHVGPAASDAGPPDCVTTWPGPGCLFLGDFPSVVSARAYDAEGRQVGRIELRPFRP